MLIRGFIIESKRKELGWGFEWPKSALLMLFLSQLKQEMALFEHFWTFEDGNRVVWGLSQLNLKVKWVIWCFVWVLYMFRYLDLQILKSKRFVFDVYELVSTIFEESHFGESQKDDIQDC